MLLKIQHADKKTIEKIFLNGSFVGSPLLSLKFFIDKSKKNNFKTISFVVPKSITKKAVERNLLRRRGYEALKKQIQLLPKGIVGVFIFGKKSKEKFSNKKNATKNPMTELEKEILNILNKIK